jgi:hypothetical protein
MASQNAWAPEVRVVDVAVDAEEALHHVAHHALKVARKGGAVALREERGVVQLHTAQQRGEAGQRMAARGMASGLPGLRKGQVFDAEQVHRKLLMPSRGGTGGHRVSQQPLCPYRAGHCCLLLNDKGLPPG